MGTIWSESAATAAVQSITKPWWAGQHLGVGGFGKPNLTFPLLTLHLLSVSNISGGFPIWCLRMAEVTLFLQNFFYAPLLSQLYNFYISFQVLSSYLGWHATYLWVFLLFSLRLLSDSTPVSQGLQPLGRQRLFSRASASLFSAWTSSWTSTCPPWSSPGPPLSSFKAFSTYPAYHGVIIKRVNGFGSEYCFV